MKPVPLRKSPRVFREYVDQLPVLVSRTSHQHALIYWHGFPGPFSEENSDELRLADHAFDLASETHDFYYPLYSSGPSGSFNFLDSVLIGSRVLDYVSKRQDYASITVVGQSWGAVIATNAYDPRLVTKLLLITPFLSIPTGEVARRMLQHYSSTHPSILPASTSTYEAQVDQIARDYNPRDVLSRPIEQLAVIAAELDEVAPVTVVRKVLPPEARVVVMKGQTHEVEDRALFRRTFSDELQRE